MSQVHRTIGYGVNSGIYLVQKEHPMKTKQPIFFFLLLVLLSGLLSSGCKKKSSDSTDSSSPSLVFAMEYYSFNLSGVDYVRFIFENKTAAVKIKTLVLLSPGGQTYTYNGDDTVIAVGQKEELPDDFPKVTGTWKFTFSGTVSSSGTAYTSVATCTVN